MSHHFLFDVALILVSTKILGLLTQRMQLPQVVGALLAGVLLGPAMLNLLQSPDFLGEVAQIGVIIMLFQAGLGTDINKLKHAGKSGFIVALLGVLVPLIMGAILTLVAEHFGMIESKGFMQALFIGTILTATSVSITVETLKELGRLDSQVGTTILAASVIDDVLGLLVLTLVTGLGGGNDNIGLVLLKLVAFVLFVVIVGWVARKFFSWLMNRAGGRNLRRFTILSFAFCLMMAYCAEEYFGVSDIIGAFTAGLIIAQTPKYDYIQLRMEPLNYLFFTPVFFANVGVQAVIKDTNAGLIIFAVLLLVVAIISKIIGCGLGAKLCHMSSHDSVEVGVGMVCRGEVALVVVNSGMALGALSPTLTMPVIVTVISCSILTPIMMKLAAPKQAK